MIDEVETPEEQVTKDEPVEGKKYRTNAGTGYDTRGSSCLSETKLY